MHLDLLCLERSVVNRTTHLYYSGVVFCLNCPLAALPFYCTESGSSLLKLVSTRPCTAGRSLFFKHAAASPAGAQGERSLRCRRCRLSARCRIRNVYGQDWILYVQNSFACIGRPSCNPMNFYGAESCVINGNLCFRISDEKEVVREAENRALAEQQRQEFLDKLSAEEKMELKNLVRKAAQRA